MELPARYGHYVLLERIAVGGMGEIFKAKYAGLAGFERPCAIKRILPHLSDDEEFADRLIHEAKVAVQLAHSNIVQIYELGKIENEYFIAMEWVDGPDLSTLLVRARAKDVPIPLALSIHVIHEVARALDHAHHKSDAAGKPLGIVHRDVSPQNIMISGTGAVKLGDFGIARAGGIARQFATNAGAVLGKRRYMSPEQRHGGAIDGRADVYALGAILYELVAGEPPDPDAAITPLSVRVPELPEELESLCMKALATDANDRLPDAAALATGLERVFMRTALAPGAIRDPSVELGKFVQKVCPPGEARPPRRSLTARMRDAMRPGVSEKSGGAAAPESTAAVAVRPAEATGDFATGAMAVGSIAPADGGTAELRVAPEETVEGMFEGREVIGAEDLAGPPLEPPAAARDGGGVTLVISTVMVPRPAPEASAVTATPDAPTAPGPSARAVDRAAETMVAPLPRSPVPTPNSKSGRAVNRATPSRPQAVPVAAAPPSGVETKIVSEPLFPPSKEPPRRRRAAIGVVAVSMIALLGGLGWLAKHGQRLSAEGGGGTTVPTATPRHVATRVAIATPAPATPHETPRPRPTHVAIVSTPRPHPTPRATPRVPDATLEIGASPWANIIVDGKPYGSLNTSVRVTSNEPHVVILKNPKFGERKLTVTVKPGETEKVIVDLRNPG